MRTHLHWDDNEWEKLESQMENENISDPDIFSRLLDNYLQKVKKVRSAYHDFCKKIFML